MYDTSLGGIKICNGCVAKVKSGDNTNDCFCFKNKLKADVIEHTYLIRDSLEE